MVFALRRSPLFFTLHVGMYIPIFVYAIIQLILDSATLGSERLLMVGLLLVVLVIIYFVSIRPYYKAKYIIQNNTLLCQSGISNHSIDIESMKTISKSSYPGSGFRSAIALSLKGIKINYGAGYTVFLTPLNQREFIDALIKVNPKIKYLAD